MDAHTIAQRGRDGIRLAGALALLASAPAGSGADAPPSAPGLDPLLTPGTAFSFAYRLGWAGLTAAEAHLAIDTDTAGRVRLHARAWTIGAARALFPLDASYESEIDTARCASVRSTMEERYRRRRVLTRLEFDGAGVAQERMVENRGRHSENRKRREGAEIRDLFGALLFLRRCDPPEGGSASVTVFPGDSLYRVTVRAVGREPMDGGEGQATDAVRLGLEIVKVERDGSTRPHRLFRRGTVWVSADPERRIVRVAVDIFVGQIFAQLIGVTRP